MQGFEFDKLCEENFAQFTSALSETMLEFPRDVEMDEDLDITTEKVSNLMKEPKFLFVDENDELYWENSEGEHVLIDPRTEDKKLFQTFMDDVFRILPNVPFELYCGGVKRKQQETAAAYVVSVVNTFLNDTYREDIDEVVKFYDFTTRKSNKRDGKVFSDVLRIIQQDATPIVKFIITCCYNKLSESKEKNDAVHIGIVSQKDQESLERMNKTISAWEYECNKKVRDTLKRKDRLELIDSKDERIKNYFKTEGKRHEILYKISKLNSTNLSPEYAPKIKQAARKEANHLLENGILTDSDYYSKFVRRQSQKAIRRLVIAMKKKAFNKFVNVSDGNFDGILPKN